MYEMHSVTKIPSPNIVDIISEHYLKSSIIVLPYLLTTSFFTVTDRLPCPYNTLSYPLTLLTLYLALGSRHSIVSHAVYPV